MSEEQRKYRSDTEILYSLLNVIISSGIRGVKKTHLMYRTNLNSKMLQRYMNMLEESGIIYEEKRGKQKIVKLSPKGSIAYSSLESLMRILQPVRESEETVFIKNELNRFLKKGWDVSFDTIVPGKSGLEHKSDALMVRNGKRVMVKLIIGTSLMGEAALLVSFYGDILDTGSKGIVITDHPELEKIVPDKLKDDIAVIEYRPLATIFDRVSEALEKLLSSA